MFHNGTINTNTTTNTTKSTVASLDMPGHVSTAFKMALFLSQAISTEAQNEADNTVAIVLGSVLGGGFIGLPLLCFCLVSLVVCIKKIAAHNENVRRNHERQRVAQPFRGQTIVSIPMQASPREMEQGFAVSGPRIPSDNENDQSSSHARESETTNSDVNSDVENEADHEEHSTSSQSTENHDEMKLSDSQHGLFNAGKIKQPLTEKSMASCLEDLGIIDVLQYPEMKNAICPITQCVMTDPVVADDGHSYERKALEQWKEKGGKCPENADLEITVMVPNSNLRSQIIEFVEKQKNLAKETATEKTIAMGS
jgi:hypothetical protein